MRRLCTGRAALCRQSSAGMNRTLSLCILLVVLATLFVIACIHPSLISDHNAFLRGFVNHELLGFLGVLVTITLASAANIHLDLNRFEERKGARIFGRTRQAIKQSAYSLLGTLVAAVVLVVAKPLLCGGETAEALANGAALFMLVFSILVLADLTVVAFSLEPDLPA